MPAIVRFLTGVYHPRERERERQVSAPGEKSKEGRGEEGEIRIGIEAIYLGIGFAVADSLRRGNDRGKGWHVDKRGHK